jgi:hypothetical protein
MCSDMISAQYEDGLVHRLARFKEKCLDQDALGLVEYGKVLIDKGCALDFGQAAGAQRSLLRRGDQCHRA